MNLQRMVLASLLVSMWYSLAAADEPQPAVATIQTARQIAQRSIAYINREGSSWRKSKGCLSCHRLTFTSWALNRAAEQDVDVPPAMLKEWNAYTSDWKSLARPEDRDTVKQHEKLQKENDAVAQLLLGQAYRDANQEAPGWVATYRQSLIAAQQKDGSWKHGGQLPSQDRPARESREVSTMWAMLALLQQTTADKQSTAAIQQAEAWLGDKTAGATTEWWALKLLIQRQQGRLEAAGKLREKLLSLQNDDGGWGWNDERESDALATGIALYALARDGYDAGQPAVRRGIEFLQDTQQEDGSWRVPGTKKKAKGRVTGTASYWGTCWAVIGALEFARQ